MSNSLFEERVFISLGVPPAFDNSFRSSRYRSREAAGAAIEAAMSGQPCLGEAALDVFLCSADVNSQLCSFVDFKNLMASKKCFYNFKNEALLLSLVEGQAKHLWGSCAMATLRRDFPDVDFHVVTEVSSPSPYLSEEAVADMFWEGMLATVLDRFQDTNGDMWILVETEEDTEHDEEFHRGHTN